MRLFGNLMKGSESSWPRELRKFRINSNKTWSGSPLSAEKLSSSSSLSSPSVDDGTSDARETNDIAGAVKVWGGGTITGAGGAIL